MHTISKLRRHAALIGALLLLLAVPVAAEDMSLEQVLEKYYETRGGLEALSKVNSMRMEGSMNANGQEIPFVLKSKRPNLLRMDFSFQGMEMTQAFDGENAWGVNPMMGSPKPQKMPEEMSKGMRQQADFDGPLVNYADKGHSVELVGKEDVEGTEAYRLKVTLKDGDVVHSFIDAEHFVEFRQETKTNFGGMEVDAVMTYGDFKTVDGLLIPHSMEQAIKGSPMTQSFNLDKVETDTDVDEASFIMPEEEPAEEEAAE